MMMARTKQRLPSAPIVLPIMLISRFSVGQDFANLKTRSCKGRDSRRLSWRNSVCSCVAYKHNQRDRNRAIKRTSLNDLRMDKPLTVDSPSSTRLRMTMTKSKQLHLSCKYLYKPSARTFKPASMVNIVVNTYTASTVVNKTLHLREAMIVMIFLK